MITDEYEPRRDRKRVDESRELIFGQHRGLIDDARRHTVSLGRRRIREIASDISIVALVLLEELRQGSGPLREAGLLAKPHARFAGRRKQRDARADEPPFLKKVTEHGRFASPCGTHQDRKAAFCHYLQRECLFLARSPLILVILRDEAKGFIELGAPIDFWGRHLTREPILNSPANNRAIIRVSL